MAAVVEKDLHNTATTVPWSSSTEAAKFGSSRNQDIWMMSISLWLQTRIDTFNKWEQIKVWLAENWVEFFQLTIIMVVSVLHHTISSVQVALKIKESSKYCYNRCIFVYICACLSLSARAASWALLLLLVRKPRGLFSLYIPRIIRLLLLLYSFLSPQVWSYPQTRWYTSSSTHHQTKDSMRTNKNKET